MVSDSDANRNEYVGVGQSRSVFALLVVLSERGVWWWLVCGRVEGVGEVGLN